MNTLKKSWITIFIWLLASVFYAYQYILRVLPNIMMPEILTQFQINADIFGQFSGLYYIGYSIMHIPLGVLLDRVGPKKVMPACILLTVLGLLPLIYTKLWIYPAFGRILIGMGSSGAILGVFKIIRLYFDKEKFTRMLGISVSIGLLGAIYGGRPVNYLMDILGWKTVLHIIIIVGCVLAIALYFMLPKTNQIEEKEHSILGDIKKVLTNTKILAVCLFAGLMVGPLEGFADVWGTEFFKASYGIDANIAAGLPSVIFLGMCFGAPFLSYLADKTKAYYPIIMICAFSMGVGFIAILYGQLNIIQLYLVLTIIGIMCAYQILSIYKASTYVESNLIGLTTAIANMFIMIFGYVFHSSIGKIVHLTWDGTLSNNIPIYSGAAFSKGLALIPLGLLLALIGYGIIYMSEKRRAFIYDKS